MFNNKKILSPAILAAFLLLIGVASCVKKDFDEPPAGGEPVTLETNATIAQLKALHVTPDGGYDRVTSDLVIGGEVIMDDRSGNYYKTIVIQDETGGIEVKFNDGFLYQQYPIGRKIYIRCKDLILTDYNNLIQLTGSTFEAGGLVEELGITEAQARSKVVKGAFAETPLAPRLITFADLTNPLYVSTLVQLEDVQFISADSSKTWADPITNNTVNRKIENCNGEQVIVRTSGYSDFAAKLTPSGKGKITCLLGVYRTDPQLYVRNPTDATFTGERCKLIEAPCNGGVKGSAVTVDFLDEKFSGTTSGQNVTLTGWTNFSTSGTRVWRGATFNNDNYIQATAFGSSDGANVTWVVTPGINANIQKNISFTSSWAYYTHQGLEVYYSTDFETTDICSANWKPLTGVTLPQASDGSGNFGNWISSGNVPLPVVPGGKVYVGFKYSGNGSANTSTWRIDNVKVQ